MAQESDEDIVVPLLLQKEDSEVDPCTVPPLACAHAKLSSVHHIESVTRLLIYLAAVCGLVPYAPVVLGLYWWTYTPCKEALLILSKKSDNDIRFSAYKNYYRQFIFSFLFLALGPIGWTIAYATTATVAFSNDPKVMKAEIECMPAPGGVETRPLYYYSSEDPDSKKDLVCESGLLQKNSLLLLGKKNKIIPPYPHLKTESQEEGPGHLTRPLRLYRDEDEFQRRAEHYFYKRSQGLKKFGTVEWPVYWESVELDVNKVIVNNSDDSTPSNKEPLTAEEDARYRKFFVDNLSSSVITAENCNKNLKPTLLSHVWNNFPSISYQFFGSALLHVDKWHLVGNAVCFLDFSINMCGLHSLKKFSTFLCLTHFFSFLTGLAFSDLNELAIQSPQIAELPDNRYFFNASLGKRQKLARHFSRLAMGLSGIVYGLLGGIFARVFVIDFALLKNSLRPRVFWFQLFCWFFLFVYLCYSSLLPSVSWHAHLGGFVSGLGLSLIMGISELKPEFPEVSEFLPGERVFKVHHRRGESGLKTKSTSQVFLPGIILGRVYEDSTVKRPSTLLWKVLMLKKTTTITEQLFDESDAISDDSSVILVVKAKELRKGMSTSSEVDAFLKDSEGCWDPLACHIFTIAVIKETVFSLFITTQSQAVEHIRKQNNENLSDQEVFEFWFKHHTKPMARQVLSVWSATSNNLEEPGKRQERLDLKGKQLFFFNLLIKDSNSNSASCKLKCNINDTKSIFKFFLPELKQELRTWAIVRRRRRNNYVFLGTAVLIIYVTVLVVVRMALWPNF